MAHRSEHWALETLFPKIDPNTRLEISATEIFSTGEAVVRGGYRPAGAGCFLFPAGATLSRNLRASRSEAGTETPPRYCAAIAEQAVCALAAVLILALVVPLRFLHLYDGDYLASLLLALRACAAGSNRKYAKANLRSDRVRALAAAALLGFAAFLATGAWLNWQLGDLWMNAPRWLRFGASAAGGLDLLFRRRSGAWARWHAGRRRALRFAMFLAMRLELWLACVLAYYTLASGQALHRSARHRPCGFSVLQRLATDALRLRTGSATAAALFGAILAAWFIAAVFPLT